jgi:hypothetical protein
MRAHTEENEEEKDDTRIRKKEENKIGGNNLSL